MINLSELIIDPRSVGKRLFMLTVKSVYNYKDGHRVSDEPVDRLYKKGGNHGYLKYNT